jgi:hypothetical protein
MVLLSSSKKIPAIGFEIHDSLTIIFLDAMQSGAKVP